MVYTDKDTSTYDGLTIYMYELDEKLMQNMENNPDNRIYYTKYDGTGNLTTVLKAPVIATKGHFYQF